MTTKQPKRPVVQCNEDCLYRDAAEIAKLFGTVPSSRQEHSPDCPAGKEVKP